MYQLYGIPNCDTVKKAKKNLESNGIEFEFIDFKKNPPNRELIKRWKLKLGELPVNKRGRTFREVKDIYESSTEPNQVKLLIEKSSLIKRPLLEKNLKPIFIGFNSEDYDQLS